MSNLLIIGNDIKALTTATVMASLGHQVSVLTLNSKPQGSLINTINETVQEYAFDYELVALWQLYNQKNVINIISHKDAISTLSSFDCIWLFFETAQSDNSCLALINTHYQQLLYTQKPIILSGIMSISEVNTTAQNMLSPDVFYVPFVFLKDGAGMSSMLTPHLLLIGEKTANSSNDVTVLAQLLQRSKNHHINTIMAVEFSRASMMAMLASRLSFVNEMSRLAERFDVSIHDVKHMMGLDSRIGASYLDAGWGFGGQTLPDELKLLKDTFVNTSTDSHLLDAIININNDQKELIFRKFWQYFNSHISQKRVRIWGAGYKAGSGRTLNSAIHPLLKLLWQYDVTTEIYDPNASDELNVIYANESRLIIKQDAFVNINEVDALFIVNYPETTRPNPNKLALIKTPVFDAQNLLTKDEIKRLCGYYTGLGQLK